VPIVIGVADLSLIAIAAMALLLMLGLDILVKVLGPLLARYIPFVGRTLAADLQSAVSWAVSTSQGWLDFAVTPLIAIALWVPDAVGALFQGVEDTFGGVYNAIHTAVNVVVPAVWIQLNAIVAENVAILNKSIGGVWAGAQSLTYSLFATAEADIAVGISHAAQYAEQVAGVALATAQANITAAEALAAAEVAQLAGVVAQDRSTLESLVTGGLAGAEAQIADSLAQAQAFATQEVTAVRDWAQQQEGALNTALTGTLTVGIAGVVAQVVTLAEELTQFRQTCGDPLCNNLGQFGQDLSALGGYIESGALFALLAAFIADPKGTAGLIEGVVTPMAQAVDSGLKAVVGLGA